MERHFARLSLKKPSSSEEAASCLHLSNLDGASGAEGVDARRAAVAGDNLAGAVAHGVEAVHGAAWAGAGTANSGVFAGRGALDLLRVDFRVVAHVTARAARAVELRGGAHEREPQSIPAQAGFGGHWIGAPPTFV